MPPQKTAAWTAFIVLVERRLAGWQRQRSFAPAAMRPLAA